MIHKTTGKTIKALSLAVLALFVLLISASCVPGDTASFIESLLKNTDGGQMTFVTSEGETVTITISKTGAAADNVTTANTQNKTSKPPYTATVKPVTTTVKPVTATVKPTAATAKPTKTPGLSDYLPVLNSIEDIFKTLGIWDKAYELQKKGLSWSQIAGELGYDKDSMYARVLELNAEKLKKAKELGLIDQAAYDYKIKYYGELALKYISKIFAETAAATSANLANFLPVLNSLEDVFKTLGAWEDAAKLYNKGLRWSQVVADLGYDKDTMYARVLELNAVKLQKAKELGLIDQAALDYKIKYYGDLALKYIEKIFAS